jgi:hypothetical protein
VGNRRLRHDRQVRHSALILSEFASQPGSAPSSAAALRHNLFGRLAPNCSLVHRGARARDVRDANYAFGYKSLMLAK